MSNTDEKQERRRLFQARLEADRASFQQRLRLSREQLERLIGFLSNSQEAPEPLGNTRRWLSQEGLDAQAVLDALGSVQMASDWDVMLNLDPFKVFGPSATRLARMPMEKAQLEELLAHLDQISSSGETCDHSLRHTRDWLALKKLPVETNLTALLALGGTCDCEVAMNLDVSAIYPAPPEPEPGAEDRAATLEALRALRGAPKKQGPKPQEYRDEALILPLPGKPWYLQAPSKGVGVHLKFGKGYMKPELRILKAAGLSVQQELAWCSERWAKLERDDDPEDDEDAGDRQIKGPTPVAHGIFQCREYVGVRESRFTYIRWWILDAPLSPRVIEFFRGAADSDPSFREAKKMLAAAQRVS